MSQQNAAVTVLSLDALAAFAVSNNFSSARGGKGLHELTIEEARAKVVVVDGNKVPAEDGSQALTLKLGKRKVALDAVKANATRINATAAQVEGFTAALLAAVAEGKFDAAIIDVQKAADPANKVATGKVATVESADDTGELEEEKLPDGLDLEELE